MHPILKSLLRALACVLLAVAVIAGLAALSGCGGGGDEAVPEPAPASAPVPDQPPPPPANCSTTPRACA